MADTDVVVDLGVEARRRLPREALRRVGEWEAAALAFAPRDGSARLLARARDTAASLACCVDSQPIAQAEADRGAGMLLRFASEFARDPVSSGAELRGAFVRLCTHIERRGLPVDEQGLREFEGKARDIRRRVASEEGVEDLLEPCGSLDSWKVRDELATRAIPRCLTPTGETSVDRAALEVAARADPSLRGLLATSEIHGALRPRRLFVSDGRNRPEMRPYRASSGRAAPRGSILSAPTMMWRFIRPEAGRALVYVDFVSQEVGIAAARSRDPALATAYGTGDPYVEFSRTIESLGTFSNPRSVAKTTMLGLQYGMGARTLGERLACDEFVARRLVNAHRSRFETYWAFVEEYLLNARSAGFVESRLGWRRVIDPWPGAPSIQNFPVQCTAVDILVVAALLTDSFGLEIVALNHDAIMVEVNEIDAKEAADVVAWAMREAAREQLDGFELRTEATVATSVTPFPRHRARDERILRIFDELRDDRAISREAPDAVQ